MKQSTRWLKYLALGAYILAFGECYSRWAIPDIRIGPSFTVNDPEHGWAIRKSFTGRRITREYDMVFTTGAQGFRGDSYTPDKPPGLLRIASLGNSQAFGVGVNDHETYSALAEKALQQKMNRPVEVINMAITDSGTGEILSMWDKILSYHPDLLVIHYDYWNFQNPYHLWTFQDGRLIKRKMTVETGGFRDIIEGLPFIRGLEKSALYGFVRLILPRYSKRLNETKNRMFGSSSKEADVASVRAGKDVNVQEYRLLEELMRRADQAGVPLVFLQFKLTFLGKSGSLEQARQNRFREITSRPHVFVLDLQWMLDNPGWFYPIDEHLNHQGHAEVAECLAEFITQQFPQWMTPSHTHTQPNLPRG